VLVPSQQYGCGLHINLTDLLGVFLFRYLTLLFRIEHISLLMPIASESSVPRKYRKDDETKNYVQQQSADRSALGDIVSYTPVSLLDVFDNINDCED
jgi:hypothetical protein